MLPCLSFNECRLTWKTECHVKYIADQSCCVIRLTLTLQEEHLQDAEDINTTDAGPPPAAEPVAAEPLAQDERGSPPEPENDFAQESSSAASDLAEMAEVRLASDTTAASQLTGQQHTSGLFYCMCLTQVMQN